MWVGFWLTVIATVFTYSRGALLGLGVVLARMLWATKRKWLVVALAVPAFFLALAYVPDQLIDRAETIQGYEADGSAMGRIQAWGVAINVASAHVFGGGFVFEAIGPSWLGYANFLFPHDNHPRTAHSIYFQVLGEHGYIGLALFVALMFTTYRALGRARRDAAGRAEVEWIPLYAEALQIGLIAYAVSGAFLSLAYFDLYYVIVAFSVIMQRECRLATSRQKVVAPPSPPRRAALGTRGSGPTARPYA
jgi:probable O-glycosylation ligase (exosortase A-associated)